MFSLQNKEGVFGLVSCRLASSCSTTTVASAHARRSRCASVAGYVNKQQRHSSVSGDGGTREISSGERRGGGRVAWGKIKIKIVFLFATTTQLRQIFPVCYVSLFVAFFSETNSRLSGAGERNALANSCHWRVAGVVRPAELGFHP